eukprot:TRINITY_DN27535_c0_g1_i1.p1 TRINITY_DN27535_c0_g1~~TRINITY_DN27535_c0_g1_i1.p1  ORF type:complete len:579 (+),score=195.93 TRINITY_DN27535_c0_g1_i1:93-1739(+)
MLEPAAAGRMPPAVLRHAVRALRGGRPRPPPPGSGGLRRCSRAAGHCGGPGVQLRALTAETGAPQSRLDRQRTSVQRGKQARVRSFRRQLDEPDHVLVSRREARQLFGLGRGELESMQHSGVPELDLARPKHFPFYWKPDVVRLALRRASADELVVRYAQLIGAELPGLDLAKGSAAAWRARPTRWYTDPPSDTPEGMDSVRQGLLSNMVIFVIKGAVWTVTRSPAVFADTMHSMADVCNYLYRLWSLRKRRPDAQHPYGYAPLRSVCADRSFVCLLVVGGVIPLLHGAQDLVLALGQPAAPDGTALFISGAILATSMFWELMATRVAAREIREQALQRRVSFQAALLRGRDIMSSATFLESASGVLGGAVGLAGIAATYATGCPWVESAAGMGMAVVVMGTATFMLNRSSEQLLHAALPLRRVTDIVTMLEADEAVDKVAGVRSQVFGHQVVHFKVEVQLRVEAVTLRRLALGRPEGDDFPTASRGKEACSVHDLLAARNRLDAEECLRRSDAAQYRALIAELDRLEDMVHGMLTDFDNVHVDIEIC